MSISAYELRKLDWDTRFFEVKMGEVLLLMENNGSDFSEVTWRCTLELARKQNYQFLFCQLEACYQEITPFLLSSGASIGDILLTFGLDLPKRPQRKKSKLEYRICQAEVNDLPGILEIAAQSFADSRFFHDSKFDRKKATQFYPQWLSESFFAAETIYVIKENETVLGFVSLKIESVSKVLIIRLIAIKESVRGVGLGQALMNQVINLAIEQKLERIQVGTQIINYPAINLYEKNGFLLMNSKYRFHIWLTT